MFVVVLGFPLVVCSQHNHARVYFLEFFALSFFGIDNRECSATKRKQTNRNCRVAAWRGGFTIVWLKLRLICVVLLGECDLKPGQKEWKLVGGANFALYFVNKEKSLKVLSLKLALLLLISGLFWFLLSFHYFSNK